MFEEPESKIGFELNFHSITVIGLKTVNDTLFNLLCQVLMKALDEALAPIESDVQSVKISWDLVNGDIGLVVLFDVFESLWQNLWNSFGNLRNRIFQVGSEKLLYLEQFFFAHISEIVLSYLFAIREKVHFKFSQFILLDASDSLQLHCPWVKLK